MGSYQSQLSKMSSRVPLCFSKRFGTAKIVPEVIEDNRTMGAWQLQSYGQLDELQYSDKVRIPSITGDNHVLVNVKATSVNPMDLVMSEGYGANTFKAMRYWKSEEIEFPLILGREFVGEIVRMGMHADSNGLQLGDRVWGVIPVQLSGAHAEFVSVDANFVTKCPQNISDANAASILYAGLTAWSGLFNSGNFEKRSTPINGDAKKRICVLGASGGVGHLAVQICLAEGATVVTTCSADAISMVTSLGADTVIDYNQPDAEKQLVTNGPYDIILDCAGKGEGYATLVPWSYSSYVTFTSPLLRNNDEFGLFGGTIRNVSRLVQHRVRSITSSNGCIKWGFFVPSPKGIDYLRKLVENKLIVPVIDSSYDFKELNLAFKRLQQGHVRGKIAVTM